MNRARDWTNGRAASIADEAMQGLISATFLAFTLEAARTDGSFSDPLFYQRVLPLASITGLLYGAIRAYLNRDTRDAYVFADRRQTAPVDGAQWYRSL